MVLNHTDLITFAVMLINDVYTYEVEYDMDQHGRIVDADDRLKKLISYLSEITGVDIDKIRDFIDRPDSGCGSDFWPDI